DLINQDSNNEKIIRPLLRGKDVSAWYPLDSRLFIINAHNGIKNKNIPRINIEKDYPTFYKWLSTFQMQLQKRSDKGDHWTNLRNCVYINDFKLPKIIYRDITQNFDFSYVEDYVISNNTTYIMTGEKLKFLTSVFNSKLFKYCFRDNFTDLGSSGRRLFTAFFEKIPIKQITNEQEKPFERIVDYLVALKKENSQEPTDQFMFIYFEQIANALVFELYFKEEFEKSDLSVAKHIEELPELNQSRNESIIMQLRKAYLKAHEQESPIRIAVESMTSIPQINLIINTVTI